MLSDMSDTKFDPDRIGGVAGIRALEELVVRGGETALKHFRDGVGVDRKPDRSPVTVADHEVEQLIRTQLLSTYPDAEFYGEETGSHGENPALRFIVDPIDGTRAFVRGLPTWSVLLGLEVYGVPALGIAYMPASQDLFVAVQGEGATHNGRTAHVSKVSRLDDALISHGALQQFYETDLFGGLERLAGATDSMRGFADFDGYRQVVLGRADAMVDPGVKPYDVCAAAVLIREAGGKLTSLSGEETIYGGGAVASNGLLHDDVLRLIKSG